MVPQRPQFVGWLAGPVTVGFAAVAHLASGATLPALPIVVASAALLSMAGSVAARVNIPAWALLLLCGLSQQGLHLLFAAASSAQPWAVPEGHGHGVPVDAPAVAAPGPAESGDGSLLLHAHVAAALLAAFLLTRRTAKGQPEKARTHGPTSS
jgi:hypothetical protein